MTVRFVHTADWQIGKPFRNFTTGLAGELAAARLDCIGRIAEIAKKNAAAHVLVAGDVFDGENLGNLEIRRGLERMAAHGTLTWLLLPGNHDPARPGGLWDRIRRIGLPGNVTALTTPEPYALGADAVLLPAPLTTKNPGRDPTEWMDSATSPPGFIRIGLAHGSVQGFGSDGDSAVLIARDRAAKAGLSYLALGDWHGTRSIAADTWYSGTPEPDRFPDNDPGHVLAVTIEGQRTCSVEKIASAKFAWAKASAAVRSTADLTALERSFAGMSVEPARLLIRVALSGSLSLAEHAAVEAWRETWAARLRHLELDMSALAVRPAAADFESLGASGPLVEAARMLSAAADDPRHADHAAAQLALVRLFGFAAEAAREASA